VQHILLCVQKGSPIKRGIVALSLQCEFSGSQVGQQHFSALQLMNSDQEGVKKGRNSSSAALIRAPSRSRTPSKGAEKKSLIDAGAAALGKRRKQMHATQKSGSLSLSHFLNFAVSVVPSFSLFPRAAFYIYRKYFIREGRPIPWFTEVSSWLISPPPKKEFAEGVKLHRVSRQIK